MSEEDRLIAIESRLDFLEALTNAQHYYDLLKKFRTLDAKDKEFVELLLEMKGNK